MGTTTQKARLWFAAVAATAVAATLAAGPPDPPEPPTDRPAPRVPTYEGSLTHQPGFAGAQLGVGRLAPARPKPFDVADWLGEVVLPLYEHAGGDLAGWLAEGWLLREGSASALGTPALIETGYESLSLVVLESRQDGWFLLRYAPADSADEGTAWTHESLLETSPLPLAFEPWEAFFLDPERQPLHYRDSSVRHALRRSASEEGEVARWIEGDHAVVPLEFQGDWARVRVRQPSDVCLEPGEWRGTEDEGWIRWRSPETGSWLWFSSRGC